MNRGKYSMSPSQSESSKTGWKVKEQDTDLREDSPPIQNQLAFLNFKTPVSQVNNIPFK